MAEEMPQDAVGLIPDGNPQHQLSGEDFTTQGELKTLSGDLALVVQSAQKARDFLQNKQWTLMWRDADLLFQAPRPMTVYENTYVLEPNVQRFTVGKVVNSVVPQLYKGLFYDDPPYILRPRPGTEQQIVDAKKALFSYLLDECRFKINTKWGMEQLAHLGTGIWKWGIDWKEIETCTRKASSQIETSGVDSHPIVDKIALDQAPDITTQTHVVPMPFFEWRPIDKVLVDPKLEVADIRETDWVIDVRYMDFYQFTDLKNSVEQSGDDGAAMEGWDFPSDADIKMIWGPATPVPTANMSVEQVTYMKGSVHHAQDINQTPADPLRKKLEVLEYWDKKRKIVVLNNVKVIFAGKNEFRMVPFLSANWWNRPKSFYGMGLGMIVGQNQRVDQGTINSILKVLSYGVNPIYLRSRNANNPTQMIRTGIGKIMTVDGEPEKAYHLLESPKVPPDVWEALHESERSTESTSGADQQLVQGSTSGPRSSMGRTAGGAAIQASASATRLDGPLDNFIEQVFKPFLYVLDMLVFRYMSDSAISLILGKEMGDALVKKLDMQQFHNAIIQYEVLAGASMSAKRTMAQSMVMLTQILDNPQIQNSLADINEEYVDFKPIIAMWMEASEWKNGQDIIKPMTPEMKQKRAQQSQAAMMQAKLQMQDQQNDKKFEQKQQLQEQSADDRIKRDLVIGAAKASGFSEPIEGQPSAAGLDGQQPNV
jgi:hypothetical protein